MLFRGSSGAQEEEGIEREDNLLLETPELEKHNHETLAYEVVKAQHTNPKVEQWERLK